MAQPQTDAQKYDRQLRLWGEVAQSRLESSRVLSIGSDCVSVEFLKAIVLPGIGFIGVADDKVVDAVDLETNFFIDIDQVGQKRGQCVLNNLLELNDRVKGEFIDMSIDKVVEKSEIYNDYDIFVCCNQPHKYVVEMSKRTKSPVFEVETNGFLGLVKVYVESQVVFDDGNVNVPMDLRIPSPFPLFQDFYNTFDFTKMDKDTHQHVPFPIILIFALNKWRQEHNTTGIPKTSDDKKQIKEIIKKESHCLFAEENFQEAYNMSFYTFQTTPVSVLELLKDKRCTGRLTEMTKEQIEFWGFLGAVKVFYEKHNRTPIDSGIKDMISSNTFFVKLQEVFTKQLDIDANEILKTAEERLNAEKVEKFKFTLEGVKRLCKALRKMYVVDGVNGETNQKWDTVDEYELTQPQSILMYLAVMYAVQDFNEKHGKFPVGNGDVAELLGLTKKVLERKEAKVEVDKTCVEQLARFGGVQIHSANSVVGSFVGQEVIKYAAHQFGCLNNTFVFNTENCLSIHGHY
ncbi:NEDD8-activating enzyme E1 regulatory subunit, putative [Entamoeba invadens IP1]|uniref:NEDD8-activating enzyme E1 regulatory subunit, putative n=1 Tax=Entamoeba invadens IP1 TaxID=370355 RepID=UPI0002C3D3FE|nr:NEDD8-activating enzyme E1 regulatory subunit, putative [Entamoeba invadens IP1]ELP93981.1 NEDD8-activating enzyme E1 regulatory subunit, putative [Entamoeba invadens IP1]|eukprot:XP_004260752.1 NEDD8-activating enzyme E1 regulatory subunit, putative [Entamoeba invadens IP1]